MLVEILVGVIIVKIIVSLIILKVSYNKIKGCKIIIKSLSNNIDLWERTNIKSREEIKNLTKEIKEIKDEMEVYIEQVNKEKKTYQPKLDQLKKIKGILES